MSLEHSFADKDAVAHRQLIEHYYDDLKRVAANRLRNTALGQSISDSSLVHDAILKVWNLEQFREEVDRKRYFATIAFAMRSILVDRVRKNELSSKHQQQQSNVGSTFGPLNSDADSCIMLDLDSALSKLQIEDPDASLVTHLHLFGTLTFLEISKILGLSERTVQRYWAFARSWLQMELEGY